MTSTRTYILLVPLIIIATASICQGTMYSYTDHEGVVHFTNAPNNSKYKPLWGHLGHTKGQGQSCFLYDSHIRDAARLFNLDPSLIKAVIKKESNFNPHAVSPKGAIGLMQLMPGTAIAMDVTNIYDPRQNIFGGSRYLRHLSNLFNGNLDLILASYNAGPDRVRITRTVPDIRETKQYVKIVRQYFVLYKKTQTWPF